LKASWIWIKGWSCSRPPVPATHTSCIRRYHLDSSARAYLPSKRGTIKMSRTLSQEKARIDPEQIEIVQDAAVQGRSTYYKPQDDAEKKLDKRVNLKLDCIVLALLAVEFIVSSAQTEGCVDHAR